MLKWECEKYEKDKRDRAEQERLERGRRGKGLEWQVDQTKKKPEVPPDISGMPMLFQNTDTGQQEEQDWWIRPSGPLEPPPQLLYPPLSPPTQPLPQLGCFEA